LDSLPKVIATSVIRSVQQGESHGGIYLIDLESEVVEHVVDWNDAAINWEGRGMDRGLRGIAFHDAHIYVAASDEIFVYDQQFNIVKSYKNQYLKHCHEIHINGHHLYITSTGFDSILVFNLTRKIFETGYVIRTPPNRNGLLLQSFDPEQAGGPPAGDSLHFNFASTTERGLAVSGLALPFLLEISKEGLSMGPPVPAGSHNTQHYRSGILTNDTASNRIAWLDLEGSLLKSVTVPEFDPDKLLMNNIPLDHARQSFARGMCITDSGLLIGGSSPSTVSVYDLDHEKTIKSINLTMDIRNSIHGLEIWPY